MTLTPRSMRPKFSDPSAQEYDALADKVRHGLLRDIEAACGDFTWNISERVKDAIKKIVESEKAELLERMRSLRQQHGDRVINAALRDYQGHPARSLWERPEIRARRTSVEAIEKEAHAARPQIGKVVSITTKRVRG